MAEVKKTASTPAAQPVLARAAESGDPAVHALLAQRQTAVSNDKPDEVDGVDERLAELGFTAK
jgi:hypothetical protein